MELLCVYVSYCMKVEHRFRFHASLSPGTAGIAASCARAAPCSQGKFARCAAAAGVHTV